jgi:hypothetical protein
MLSAHREAAMGTAIGILLVAATIGSFVAINVRARRMSPTRQSDPGWIPDPQMGQPEAEHRSGHHGGHHGDGSIGGDHHGGHLGGFSGGDFGGGGHHG